MHKHSNSIISGIPQDPEICSENEVSLSDRMNGEQDLPISEQASVLPEVEVTQERQRTATPPPRVVDGTIIESTLLGAVDSEQCNPPRVQRCRRLLHVSLTLRVRDDDGRFVQATAVRPGNDHVDRQRRILA